MALSDYISQNKAYTYYIHSGKPFEDKLEAYKEFILEYKQEYRIQAPSTSCIGEYYSSISTNAMLNEEIKHSIGIGLSPGEQNAVEYDALVQLYNTCSQR